MQKIKVLFVCHGNICRSPMAEYILKELDKENRFYVESRATTTEEIGNDIYPPVKEVLNKHNIKYDKHRATKITTNDYYDFDYIICMDEENLRHLKYILPSQNKTMLLSNNIIEDPWYTRNFEFCYKQIYEAVKKLIDVL